MRTIRVFVSVSDGLAEAGTAVRDLLVHLNKHFKPRGVEFLPTPPGAEPSTGDFALALYWRDFGPLPKEDFEKAYESFKASKSPKVYVFFRDPDPDITEALKAFKDSFSEKYGHFYCHFENVDSVKFQLAVQSLSLLPEAESRKELSVENGEVRLGNEFVAKLDNLSFAKLNAKRKLLSRQIAAAEDDVAALEADEAKFPDDTDVGDSLREARKKRNDLKEELKQYDGFLVGAAVFFAKASAEEMDWRVRKARSLFEQGKVQAANQVLDLTELCASAKRTFELFDRNRKTCEKDVQAFEAKAEMVMADDTMPLGKRYETAFEAYRKAVPIARKIRIDSEEFVGLLVRSSWSCRNLARFDEAEALLNEALAFLQGEKNMESRVRIRQLASILFALSFFYDDRNQLDKAIETARTLIRLLDDSPNDLQLEVRDIYGAAQHNLGVCWRRCGKPASAEASLREAIKIRRSLVETAGDSTPVVESLLELGGVLCDLERLPEAECCFEEARMELDGKHAPLGDSSQLRAGLFECLALVHARQDQFTKSEFEWTKAIEIRREFFERNPGIQLEKLPADLIDLGILFWNHGQSAISIGKWNAAESFLGRMARTSSTIYERARLNMLYSIGLSELGRVAESNNRMQEAVRLSRELVRSFPEIDKYRHLAMLSTYNQGAMVSLSENRKDLKMAERILKDAIRMAEEFDSSKTAIQSIRLSAMVAQASVLLKLEKRTESERLAKKCCDWLEQMMGGHSDRFSLSPASMKQLYDVLSNIWDSGHPAWIESAMRRLKDRQSCIDEFRTGGDLLL